jgi:hypothetical protein
MIEHFQERLAIIKKRLFVPLGRVSNMGDPPTAMAIPMRMLVPEVNLTSA